MAVSGKKLIAIGTTAILLAGCDSLWPSLDPLDPTGNGDADTTASAPPPAPPAPQPPQQTAEQPAQPAAATAPQSAPDQQTAQQEGRQAGQASQGLSQSTASLGAAQPTFVGDKVSQMQNDLAKLRASIEKLKGRAEDVRSVANQGAGQYHELVASITSRLQNGTTPGNPVLVSQWNAAQQRLESIAEKVPQMTTLSNDAANEAAFGQYLLSSVQATYGLSGAVEDDHQRLQSLEDNVHQSVVEIDRMLTELSQDIRRQNIYVNNERQNMTTLSLAIKNGELYGSSISTRAFTQTENLARAEARAATPDSNQRPLVIIKFDRENVNYQQALYNAVSQALDRKPNATFDLVAVSPTDGTASQVALNNAAARRNAEDVLRTLTDMGVSPSRVQLLASTEQVNTNQVRLFVN